jgi:hypothetical protein
MQTAASNPEQMAGESLVSWIVSLHKEKEAGSVNRQELRTDVYIERCVV